VSGAETAAPLQHSRAAGVPADTSANTQFDLIGNRFWIRRYLSAPNPASSPTVRGEYGKGPVSDSHVTSPFQDVGNIWRTLFQTPCGLGLLSIRTLLGCNALICKDGRITVPTPLPWEAESLPAALAVSATVPVRDLEAEARFKAVFQRGRDERFEDGMENEFSQELESLLTAYGSRSKEILSRLLEDESISEEVWAEAMRWLGRFDDPTSHDARLWLLEKGLSSRSAYVRDGAALGLASLDHPSAIPYLERAIHSENIAELRADMQEVLSQLTSHE
jgi:hypothetical protein